MRASTANSCSTARPSSRCRHGGRRTLLSSCADRRLGAHRVFITPAAAIDRRTRKTLNRPPFAEARMASAEIQAFESAGGPDRLRTSVRLLFIGVFVTLAAVLTASLLYNRHEALANGERRAENLALILSNHFARTVSVIDTTLKQVALVSSRIGGPDADTGAWTSVLDAARSGVEGLAVLVVLDEAG